MFFKDIIGQDDVKRRLIESVKNGHIAHAQLFEGNDGAGALPLALAYARYIQCTHRGEDDACGECPSCRQMTALMHPDVHFVFPIANKKQKKEPVCDDYIAEWRNYVGETPYPSAESWQQFLATGNSQPLIYVHEAREIIRKLSLKSFESEYKIMIIWQAHLMNDACSNAILKLLEEPFDRTLYLLVSDRPENILETIRSRTQRIKVPPLTTDAIATALQGQPTRQGFLQELSGKGIAAILWQNDSGVIYGVTYIDHNSKTVFKGSLLGKEYSASVINRKYGTIPPEKTEEAPVIHPSEPEMKETELVEGLLDIFSLESYPYPADDLTQSPYGKKKKRKRRGPHLG